MTLLPSWDSVVRTATTDSILGGRFSFSSSKNPDRFWGPPSLPFSGYRWLFSLR